MRTRLLLLPLALMLGTAAAQAQPTPPPGRPAERHMPPSPERLAERRTDLCQEFHARTAGRLAELEVRLKLTAAQRGTFERWRDIRLTAARQRADACASAPMPRERQAEAAANPAERLGREEQRLRQRLADISAERPALEALYNSLSPDQREKFRPDAGPRDRLRGGGPFSRTVMRLRDMPGRPAMSLPSLPPQ